MQYFHTKLSCQKPMLRQIEWEVQNGTITKDGVLPLTTLVFWKFCFRGRTSSKVLIRCTNYPNVHIHTFRKRWSFIWRCFFPVGILKELNFPRPKDSENYNKDSPNLLLIALGTMRLLVRTPMPKCDFNKVAAYFQKTVSNNTSGGVLLCFVD